jgi:hypothetical protein
MKWPTTERRGGVRGAVQLAIAAFTEHLPEQRGDSQAVAATREHLPDRPK